MKLVILAGGMGTRISEESILKPKPMIDIGGMPIIWHIMKIYSHFGIDDFIICAGYKQQIIKEWFADYFLNSSDITFDYSRDGDITIHNRHAEAWKVTIVDTGLNTNTGGRIKRVKQYIGDKPFLMTYGDAVGDVNILEIIKSHNVSKAYATVTVYNYGQRKGIVDIDNNGRVLSFREKYKKDSELINIGFFVLEPCIFDYIESDDTPFEGEPLEKLVDICKLNAYVHTGFWQCMDTLREKQTLEKLWDLGKAPWKIWED